MPSVFIIEDDERLLEELEVTLEADNITVATACGYNKLAQQALDSQADCILLDITLPQTDGRLIAREIRQKSSVPIIILTCLDSEFDEVSAMDSGADDFLTKPVRPSILVAHVKAALRRRKTQRSESLAYHQVELNPSSGVASYQGRKVQLSRNEVIIFEILLRNAGQTVSRHELMCGLWESDAFVDANTLTVNINRLRKSLAIIKVPDDFITTKRGEGYRL